MKIHELSTPQFLLDKETLENNINRYAQAAKDNNKQLMPMTKTHKSTAIAQMQADFGADGFLCGTLLEAEKLTFLQLPLRLAYPFIGKSNLDRIYDIAEQTEVFLSLDGMEAALEYEHYFSARSKTMNFYLIIDSGLHRFGVAPSDAGKMARSIINACPSLRFAGITTHPGQVYGCETNADVKAVAIEEISAVRCALESLEAADVPYITAASGSTPTYFEEAQSDCIDILHPGNYVFNDVIQLANGTASESDCALTVLARIISHPTPDRFILDCGSKCLGLDKGAHGNTAIVGFGRILGHSELIVSSLSEEVAKVTITGSCDLKVGDLVRIIPNHSCSAANMCSYMVLVSGDEVLSLIETDIRGNSLKPVIE